VALPQLARANVRQKEEVGGGGVPWRVYGALARRSLPLVLSFALLLLVLSPAVGLLANLVLAKW
jgi:hypothetical protein